MPESLSRRARLQASVLQLSSPGYRDRCVRFRGRGRGHSGSGRWTERHAKQRTQAAD